MEIVSLLLFEPWVSSYQFGSLFPGLSEPYTRGGGPDGQPGNANESSKVQSRLGKVYLSCWSCRAQWELGWEVMGWEPCGLAEIESSALLVQTWVPSLYAYCHVHGFYNEERTHS